MNDLWVYLVDNSFLIMWVAITAALLTSAYDSHKDKAKKKKIKAALIEPPKENEVLSQEDFNTKFERDKLDRLMKIHGIEEDKAIELQKLIDQEWENTKEWAQKHLDEANKERLTKL